MTKNTLMATYNRLPVTFTHGKGAYLWDDQGQKYFDLLSGIAVCSLGHAHPNITAAISAQAEKLLHTSNLYQIGNQSLLADKLIAKSGMENVFFSNSGAEANEAAIKLARLFGHQKGIDNPTIIVMEQSFHGRTLATLSATGNRKVHAGFEPLVQGFIRLPFDDLDAIQRVADHVQICAILVEPIQGEGGVHIPQADYLTKIRQYCDQNDWLMMCDEIQTGIGRTGELFAFQHTDIKPDVMTLAKALGNGVPIGATLAAGKAAHLFTAGKHGTTFGGNPLACMAALSVLETLEKDQLVARSKQLGEQIIEGFKTTLADHSAVVDIRGQGLIIGIELNRSCAELVGIALAKGLLINVTADKVVRLLPPLILTDEQANDVVAQVSTLIIDFLKSS